MTVNEWLGNENELGLKIYDSKYRHNEEDFECFLDRVSGGDEELRKYVKQKKILLGGRTLTNRGTDSSASYFNCYSRGFVEDDYRDIMQAAVDIGLTFKSQGGQGISLSKLRPKGTPIGKEYSSDGIIPFMKIYNEVTAGTSQGGSRKGALMLSIDARHKEAIDFIHIKSTEGSIEKANLSLEIDDEFMRAVEKYYQTGEIVTLHEKRNYSGHVVEYDVVPIKVFEALVQNSYDWADPACLFVDEFRNHNLMQYDPNYQIETCNPCGEQPLPKHGACCLASLNLSEFVKNPYTEQAHVDVSDFVNAVRVGIETLDKLIDENYSRHPLEEQQKMSYNYRNIGLGIFGYATALMKLGMKYGSNEAIKFTEEIFGMMFKAAVIKSNELAKEYGPFPKYNDLLFDADILKEHFTQDELDAMKPYGLRNCSLLSIAPTGSISNLLNESGGCEPEFALKYTRRTIGMTEGQDTYFDVYCKAAREYMAFTGKHELPDYFVSSSDIPWEARIATQAAMQRHVDTAISSTVNLPESATCEDIAQLYLESWKQKLKGVTIFRSGCKRMPILSTKANTSTKEEPYRELSRGDIIECSNELVGKKRKLTTGCGSLHVMAYFDPVTAELQECFLAKGSTGGCANFMTGLSRTISLLARAGVSVYTIQDQLNSTGTCPSYATRRAVSHDTSKGSCCPMAVGNALIEMYEEMLDEVLYDESGDCEECVCHNDTRETVSDKCPQCGENVIYEVGCMTCKSCGWTKCE